MEDSKKAMENEAGLKGETVRSEMPVFATVHGSHGYPEHLHRALRGLLEWSHAPTIQTKKDDSLESPQEAELRIYQHQKRTTANTRNNYLK